ncbi:hypothetical protein QZH36_08475 [Erwinia sp. BC051422]|uniref:hypothetical protein n=1 Tax=Erwinia wuhanensis TaxID=3045167 RepID=UPI00264EE134|nr:hypothetical protein [Erwinia sp. BC051422]MDN8541472.1 hypothetical protein [Erwinia sp. BC051422]
MNMWITLITMTLLMNIPAAIPVLLLQADKKIKIAIAARLYLLGFFLVMALTILTSGFISKYSPFPVWLSIASVVAFIITLINCARYMHQHISKWQRRSVVLASFLIIYAVRFKATFIDTGAGYEITSFGMVWSALFFFACFLAYIGTSNPRDTSAAYNPLSDSPSSSRVDKSYAPQSDIDYDVNMKGKDILNDTSLSVIEKKRYRDALQKKEDGSDW